MEANILPPFSLVLRTSLTAAVLLISLPLSSEDTQRKAIIFENRSHVLFPAASKEQPQVPSPHRTADGSEILTICTQQGNYALVPVTITTGIATRPWEAPLEIDREDFPTLAKTGLHSEAELDRIRSITGRSLEEITELGRPGRLSTSGFMAEDEDVLSVIKGDHQLVTKLGLTHPELARPLLHVCNLLRVVYRDSGQHRTNDFFYGGKRLNLEVEFTRGGQKSIFNDGLDGAWAIRIRRELDPTEEALLDRAYAHLKSYQRKTLRTDLTQIVTGEMQPFYIYRYGFYEGHTGWRADPIAIALMFGLKPLEEIEAAFPGRLHVVLTQHFVSD